jgi:flagellar biosynthesis protein FlhB
MDSTGKFSIFRQEFWGTLNPELLAAAFVMALIGIALSALLFTTKRDPLSARTPTHFSWKFFWNDNTKRIVKSILTTVLILFITIRFSQELMGQKLTMFYAFGLGFGLDKVIEKLRKKKEE